MTEVKLEALSKRFGEIAAVDAVDLTIESGEFIVLVGPSGSGKTTCLRMIAGLEMVSAGAIYIGDRDVAKVHAKDRDVAMVFQLYALYPHMTVAENMGFALKLRKMPRDEIKRRVHEVAEILGITEELPRRPKTLSGGQQQRVALGRAIVRDPAVFLFDEPLSNLDAKLRVSMRSELIKLHHRLDATMIYVTHDQTEAMTMGDRIVVMDEGRIQQVGTPLNVYDNPDNIFVAGFIGSPTINLLRGGVKPAAGLATFEAEGVAFELPTNHAAAQEEDVTLGIRPEFISLGSGLGAANINCRVDAVEHLGAETILELSAEGLSLTAKMARNNALHHGEKVCVHAAPEKILAFDSHSGNRLRS